MSCDRQASRARARRAHGGLSRFAFSLAALAAVAVVLVAYAGNPWSSVRAAPAGAQALCGAGDHMLTFIADGEAHQALIHVPRGVRGQVPLVLAFHGARYGARFVAAYYGLSRLSDSQHFVVAYPQASHNVFWELPPGQNEDVDAVSALLDRLTALSCIDAARIYATGASNGGGFTARLGCEMADRLAAIAPVAGGYAPLGPCHPTRPLPVLEIHGTRDQVVPYAGKGEDHDGSVAHFLAEWTDLDRCTGPPERTVVQRDVLRLLWEACAGGSVVEHLRLAGTNHGWPGGDTDAAGLKNHPIPSEDPSGIKAADVVWDFFSRFRLPAPAATP